MKKPFGYTKQNAHFGVCAYYVLDGQDYTVLTEPAFQLYMYIFQGVLTQKCFALVVYVQYKKRHVALIQAKACVTGSKTMFSNTVVYP